MLVIRINLRATEPSIKQRAVPRAAVPECIVTPIIVRLGASARIDSSLGFDAPPTAGLVIRCPAEQFA